MNNPERNGPCPCGSGIKYKKCCLGKPLAGTSSAAVPSLATAFQLHRAGRLNEAGKLYRAVLAHAPDQPDALHGLGLLAYQAGDHAAAWELMTRASRRQPNPALYNNMGLVRLAQEQPFEATACFHAALALRPNYLEALEGLATAYGRCGHLAEACAALEQAVALQPDLPSLHRRLGDALTLQGQAERAVASYRRALALQPEDVDLLNELGIALFDHGLPDEATASYRRALELAPDDAGVLNNLGIALMDRGCLEEAIDSLQTALALKPDSTEAHCNLGKALLRQGNHAAGLEMIRAATGVIRFGPGRDPGLIVETANAPD